MGTGALGVGGRLAIDDGLMKEKMDVESSAWRRLKEQTEAPDSPTQGPIGNTT